MQARETFVGWELGRKASRAQPCGYTTVKKVNLLLEICLGVPSEIWATFPIRSQRKFMNR